MMAPDDDLMRADARLRCYLAHIGATHLAWTTWTDDDATRQQVADRVAHVLGR